MEDAFRRILKRLPFPLLETHPDNGSEFFIAHLLRFWQATVKVAQLSRSRPYHKNDNRFVEQKNHTLVRGYLGHDRLDTVAQTKAVNELYDKLWLFDNFFQPVMRLQEKTLIPVEGQASRLRRRFDEARTPFDHLCATQVLPPARRAALQALRTQTNPHRLKQESDALIEHIFTLPNAVAGVSEHVFDTLAASASS
jgi:hypothetical protein